ncbi:MAG: gliding motility-associated C-terminal domain-containing protein, partial [Saprospiraceae bacterium]|nr:gliding motility-associated C-terminal domain-containing protein [Saprospiraceae bacterium]
EDLRANSSSEAIRVSWQRPYRCEMTDDAYFRGFSLWRRIGSNNFEVDSCTPGMEGRGYQQIGFNILDFDGDRYFFDDTDVERGKTYCYRVVGEFALLTQSGNPFNRVASLPSDEYCVQLSRDIPLITQVSVRETSGNEGVMDITWIKPLPEELDTILNPGPYRFQLLRADGIRGTAFAPVPNGVFMSPTFKGLRDTMVVQSMFDTETTGHAYRIDFAANGGAVIFDDAPPSSSVFLETIPTDEAVELTWDFETSWENFAYEIFRSDGQGPFELVGTTADLSYRDENLTNGDTYCYFIRSTGSYGINSIPDPLLNDSQIACAVPVDDVAPCAPLIEVRNICGEASNTTPEDVFKNTITWNDDPSCSDDDVAAFRLYYAAFQGADFEEVEEISATASHFTLHQPDRGIAGCYAVTAVDMHGNESAFSNIVCVENCPFYELPNAFTPNGDGSNDEFVPFAYRFVDRVDFKVFNRWGQLVFQTSDPDINWDGTNLRGTDLSDGVYHYVCRVFTQSPAEGSQALQTLTGFIELIRGPR